FHLGGSLGIANNRIEHDGVGDSDLDDAAGLGASAWAGYGWWISKNWSIGALGQVTASFGDSVNHAMSARTLAVTGMFSLLYHCAGAAAGAPMAMISPLRQLSRTCPSPSGVSAVG